MDLVIHPFGTPLMCDDVKSRILYTFASGFIGRLEEFLEGYRDEEGALDAKRGLELPLVIAQAQTIASDLSLLVAGQDPSVYARAAVAGLYARFGPMDDSYRNKRLAASVREDLEREARIHTEVSVFLFTSPANSDGQKARLTGALLECVLTELARFLEVNADESGDLGVQGTDALLAILNVSVAMIYGMKASEVTSAGVFDLVDAIERVREYCPEWIAGSLPAADEAIQRIYDAITVHAFGCERAPLGSLELLN